MNNAMEMSMQMQQEPKETFPPLHVNAHGYDSPYLVKAFIEDETGTPVCGLYEGDGALARLFAAAPALYEAVKELIGVEYRHGSPAKREAEFLAAIEQGRAALALVDDPQTKETK